MAKPCLMKIISLILVSLLLNSCIQNQQKGNAKKDSLPKSLTIDTVEINDSTDFENYFVETDTAYFYARADSNAKMKTYLTKNEWTIICKKNGEFGYAVRSLDSNIITPMWTDSIEPKGWLKLRDLKQLLFTPPKIANE